MRPRTEQLWHEGNALPGDSRQEFRFRVDVFLRWTNDGNRRTRWLFHDIARFVDSDGQTELVLAEEVSQANGAH